jgi:hypothetical protein
VLAVFASECVMVSSELLLLNRCQFPPKVFAVLRILQLTKTTHCNTFIIPNRR